MTGDGDPGSKETSSMLMCLLRSLEELPGGIGQGNLEGFLEEVAAQQSPVTWDKGTWRGRGQTDWSGQGPSAVTSGSISSQGGNTIRQAEGQGCPGGMSSLSPATVSAPPLLPGMLVPCPPEWDESAVGPER